MRNMKMKSKTRKESDFSYHLDNFLMVYMPGRNLSKNTITSYGDALLLFMDFIEEKHNIQRQKLGISDISQDIVEEYIQWLGAERGNSVSTCNNRLAAIKAFLAYVAKKDAKCVYISKKVMEIEAKEAPTPLIKHLSKEQTKLLIELPNKNNKRGRRNMTMLSLLYDSAARVQELCDLTVGDVRTDGPPVVNLTGKGNKTRTVPIMHGTAKLLQSYLEENRLNTPDKANHPLFFNADGMKLTRAGVAYVLNKYYTEARTKDPTMPEKISPHVLRHSKAMHMLQSGVHLVYIRDFLGHKFIQTTEIYAHADPETKRKDIEKAQLEIDTDLPDWNMNSRLMDYLEGLRKS